jgi:hypothetical protein
MDRAGTAPLRAAPLQSRRQAEVIEQAGDGKLLLDVREIEPDIRAIDTHPLVGYSGIAGRGHKNVDFDAARSLRL